MDKDFRKQKRERKYTFVQIIKYKPDIETNGRYRNKSINFYRGNLSYHCQLPHIITYFDNGQVEYIGHYLEGRSVLHRPYGPASIWYYYDSSSKSRLKSEAYYKEGKKHRSSSLRGKGGRPAYIVVLFP